VNFGLRIGLGERNPQVSWKRSVLVFYAGKIFSGYYTTEISRYVLPTLSITHNKTFMSAVKRWIRKC